MSYVLVTASRDGHFFVGSGVLLVLMELQELRAPELQALGDLLALQV